MASNFPATAIDSFTTKVDGVDYPSAAHINDIQDAIVAVQTKIGIDGSADIDSIDYRLFNKIYPIGSYYFNGAVDTNPATLLGFGTWVAVSDRMIVGKGSTFATLLATGGARTVTLGIGEIPSHNHGGATGGQSADHSHQGASQAGDQDGSGSNGAINGGGTTSGVSNDHTHGISAQGGGGAHNNMPPYEVACIWRRTA